MILYPAIDIRDGRAVRLAQGDFAAETVYGEDPLSAARAWVEGGARWLHVVDLDGARSGAPANLEHLGRICGELDVPVQFGGGLRSPESVRAALAAGAERVILGTAAYSDVDFLDDALHAHGDRVIVSVDVRGGRVASAGWTEQTEMEAGAVIEHLQRRGVRRLVYSSIERDGMLTGPDLAEVARVSDAVRGQFIYSGGIGSLAHLRALAGLRKLNLGGVIVGKALYERRFGVAEARAALGDEPGERRPARKRGEQAAEPPDPAAG
jgi:phosphoribosylformimino-5-aminoimidazole carboxamide ribotide isomerase